MERIILQMAVVTSGTQFIIRKMMAIRMIITLHNIGGVLKSRYASDYGARAALYQNSIDYNAAPMIPNNPLPIQGAANQSTSQNLSWNGGDPDIDSVTYTTYLDTSQIRQHRSARELQLYVQFPV